MRRSSFFALVLALLIGGAAQAQGGVWLTWLYDGAGVMTAIAPDGQVVGEVTLPTVQGQRHPARVAVSRGGRLVAYVTTNPDFNAHSLILYNLETGTLQAQYVATDLVADSLKFNAGPLLFNDDDSAVAFGLTGLDGIWRVVVLNTASGALIAELRADAPAVTALGLLTGIDRVPVVTHVGATEVAFTIMPTADLAGVDYGSYLWTVASGELRDNTLFPSADSAFLAATGEIVVALRDASLPNNDSAFPLRGQQNALHVYDPTLGQRFPFYNDPVHDLTRPHFVQNGERLIVQMLDANGSGGWIVMERSGAVVGALAMPVDTLYGLVDGFVYLTRPTAPDAAPMLMFVNTRDGVDAGTPLAQGAPGAPVQLAWAGGPPAETPTAYTPWPNLLRLPSPPGSVVQRPENLPPTDVPPTAVVIVPSETPPAAQDEDAFFVAPTPSFLPTPQSFRSQLDIGITAVVTEAGNQRGLHTEPAAGAPAIILLFREMIVDVIDGPLILDGYIWWRVRVRRDGTEGWAIEGASGDAWLMPAAG